MCDTRKLSLYLWLLVGAFAVRVVAQPLALIVDAGFLPRFDDWHGGVVAYPVLLAAQLLVLAALARVAWGISAARKQPCRLLGAPLLILGSVYFAAMCARGLLGLTVLSDDRWFASPLPTFFHLLLAAFVLLTGLFHRYGPVSRGAGCG